MWQKSFIIVILFYFFALLQHSFFTHFNLFGATPNLVYILFFLLLFTSKIGENISNNYYIVSLSFVAGLFLDIYSYTYIGPSIIILLLISFLFIKAKALLQSRDNSYPFEYFLPLFIISILAYDLSIGCYLRFVEPNKIAMISSFQLVISLIYNSVVASIFFFLNKKINEKLSNKKF
ncbi:MAG: rod shape-determining protein MreD [Candidatus Staskawiczbacteria bacterium]